MLLAAGQFWSMGLIKSTRHLCELVAQAPPLLRIHHLHVRNHATKPINEVVAIVTILRGEAVLLCLMQNGAQTLGRAARHIGSLVDNNASDGLTRVRALHASFT